VLAATFDARMWSIDMSACVSILLTTCTLCTPLLFVAGSRSIKQIELFFCYPMANVHYISEHVSLLQQVLSDVFYLGGMMKAFEYHSIGPLLFYLVRMIVDVRLIEGFDERSISFWG
jgi:hypothetical protein